MRCDNCGWMNPEGLEVCQKCNQKLRHVVCEPQVVVSTTEHEESVKVVNCDKCGKEYPIDSLSCPYCGFANQNGKVTPSKAAKMDLNKTIAFAMVDHETSSDTTDNNDGKQAPVSAPKLPFGIKDSSDLKKTLVVNAENIGVQSGEPESQPKSSEPEMPKALKPSFDPKATIVDASAVALMQTVCDSNGECKNTASVANENCYTLHSMDHSGNTPIVLTITATESIGLKANDIILIDGIRYCAK